MTSLSSEEATYIPSKEQVEEIPEKYESTVVVPASQNQRQVIHTDKGVEISLTIKLPKLMLACPGTSHSMNLVCLGARERNTWNPPQWQCVKLVN